MSAHIFALLYLLGIISHSHQAEIEVRRYYEIENGDGTVLTVEGNAIENTRVITTRRSRVNDGHAAKQRFWIGSRIIVDRTTYEISPEIQNAFSSLVLEQNQQSGRLYQQVRLLTVRQWWKITSIGIDNWFIQNDQSGLCLSSAGDGNQVIGELCNSSARNQTWFFNIVKTGGGGIRMTP